MAEISIEEWTERVNIRDSIILNEGGYCTEPIKDHTIDDELEEIVEALPIGEYFSIVRMAKEIGKSKEVIRDYFDRWCFENNKELKVLQGAGRGSIILELEE